MSKTFWMCLILLFIIAYLAPALEIYQYAATHEWNDFFNLAFKLFITDNVATTFLITCGLYLLLLLLPLPATYGLIQLLVALACLFAFASSQQSVPQLCAAFGGIVFSSLAMLRYRQLKIKELCLACAEYQKTYRIGNQAVLTNNEADDYQLPEDENGSVPPETCDVSRILDPASLVHQHTLKEMSTVKPKGLNHLKGQKRPRTPAKTVPYHYDAITGGSYHDSYQSEKKALERVQKICNGLVSNMIWINVSGYTISLKDFGTLLPAVRAACRGNNSELVAIQQQLSDAGYSIPLYPRSKTQHDEINSVIDLAFGGSGSNAADNSTDAADDTDTAVTGADSKNWSYHAANNHILQGEDQSRIVLNRPPRCRSVSSQLKQNFAYVVSVFLHHLTCALNEHHIPDNILYHSDWSKNINQINQRLNTRTIAGTNSNPRTTMPLQQNRTMDFELLGAIFDNSYRANNYIGAMLIFPSSTSTLQKLLPLVRPLFTFVTILTAIYGLLRGETLSLFIRLQLAQFSEFLANVPDGMILAAHAAALIQGYKTWLMLLIITIILGGFVLIASMANPKPRIASASSPATKDAAAAAAETAAVTAKAAAAAGSTRAAASTGRSKQVGSDDHNSTKAMIFNLNLVLLLMYLLIGGGIIWKGEVISLYQDMRSDQQAVTAYLNSYHQYAQKWNITRNYSMASPDEIAKIPAFEESKELIWHTVYLSKRRFFFAYGPVSSGFTPLQQLTASCYDQATRWISVYLPQTLNHAGDSNSSSIYFDESITLSKNTNVNANTYRIAYTPKLHILVSLSRSTPHIK